MKVELPEDNWAILLEPRKVSERRRRPVTNLMVRLYKDASAIQALAGKGDADAAAEQVSPEAVELLEQINDAVVVALVDQWSYDDAPSLDALLDLPGDAYSKLREVCAPMAAQLTPDFDTPNVDNVEGPS